MTKKCTNEIVTLFWEDGQKVALLHQNGEIEVYMLKKASRQDVADLLEVETNTI